MKKQNVKLLEELGASKQDIERISKWFEKIDEDEFIERFKQFYEQGKKEGYKERALVSYARRWARYSFADELSSRSVKKKFLVVSCSGTILTKFARSELTDDEISDLAIGEIPEKLAGARDEKHIPKPTWVKSYDVVEIMNDGNPSKNPTRLMLYDENVKIDVPTNAIVECNVNVSNDGRFNWAKDSEKSMKVIKDNVDISEFVKPVNAVIIYDTGKFTTRNTRRLDIMINENNNWKKPKLRKSIVWLNDELVDMDVPPALTPVSFAGFESLGGTYNNICLLYTSPSPRDQA